MDSWIPTSHDVWLCWGRYGLFDANNGFMSIIYIYIYPLSSLPHSPFRCIPWYFPKIPHSTFNRNPTEDRCGSRPVSLALPLEHGDLDEFHLMIFSPGTQVDFQLDSILKTSTKGRSHHPATGWNHHETWALSSKLLHWYVLPGQWIGSAWPVQMLRKESGKSHLCHPEKTVINQPQSIPSLVFFEWACFSPYRKTWSFFPNVLQYHNVSYIHMIQYAWYGFTTLRMIWVSHSHRQSLVPPVWNLAPSPTNYAHRAGKARSLGSRNQSDWLSGRWKIIPMEFTEFTPCYPMFIAYIPMFHGFKETIFWLKKIPTCEADIKIMINPKKKKHSSWIHPPIGTVLWHGPSPRLGHFHCPCHGHRHRGRPSRELPRDLRAPKPWM